MILYKKMKKVSKRGNWKTVRKYFNDVHLWVGLISGLFVFVICLSGTIYVYNTEIRELSAPHLHRVDVKDQIIDINELSEIVQQASQAKITSINVPSDPSKSYLINVRKEGDKSRFGEGYFVDPYTGQILGTTKEENKTSQFMGYMFSLHRWLLLDKVETPIIGELPNRKLGSYISGGMTILFTIGLLTGIVIWLPRKIRNWRQGLTIKFDSNWKRINHDIHNSLAFYAFIFLLIMGLTGPQWSFEWYRDGLRKTLGTYQEAPEKGKGKGNKEKDEPKPAEVDFELLPITTYIASAENIFPHTGDLRISLPAKSGDDVKISKYKAGFFAPAAADQLSLKAQDASVQEVSIFRDKPLNERISGSIKALHIGDVYGQYSNLIYCLACLIATSLPVTGILIWLNKMKKKKKVTKKIQLKELSHESI